MYQAIFTEALLGFHNIVDTETTSSDFYNKDMAQLVTEVTEYLKNKLDEDSDAELPNGMWIFYNGDPFKYVQFNIIPARVELVIT